MATRTHSQPAINGVWLAPGISVPWSVRRSKCLSQMAAAEVSIGFLVLANSLPPALAVLRCRQLRELVMYQLVASVSLAETLTGLISVILGSLKLLQVPISNWACVVAVHFRYAVAGSTAICFFCISMERYVTVIHGLRYYDILTDARRRLLVAASWFFTALFFCTSVAMLWSSPQGIDLRGETCEHFRAVTLDFRFFGAVFSLILYLVNAGINIRVGIVGFQQARKIKQVQTSIGGNNIRIQLQQRGFVAIAVLSLIYCLFVVPNALYNVFQMLGLAVQTSARATGFMRLFGMMADGWCLTLLCPMLRKECMKMFGFRSKKRYIARPASGDRQRRQVNANRSESDPHVTQNKGKRTNPEYNGPKPQASRALVPTGAPLVSPSSGVRQANRLVTAADSRQHTTDQQTCAKPTAKTRPADLGRGREVILLPVDLAHNRATDSPKIHGVRRSTRSAPPVRPPPPNRLSWSRQYSE